MVSTVQYHSKLFSSGQRYGIEVQLLKYSTVVLLQIRWPPTAQWFPRDARLKAQCSVQELERWYCKVSKRLTTSFVEGILLLEDGSSILLLQYWW